MTEEEKREKLSSIEVSIDKKGFAAFKVKKYFNEEEESSTDVISGIDSDIRELKSRFKQDE